MHSITTRAATLQDMGILLQFEQGVIAAERPFDSTLQEGTINYYDLKMLIESPNAEVVVAELNGEIIASGYGLIKPAQAFYKHSEYVHLGFMYVLPAYRGKGVNQKIIDALKQWAVFKNINEIRLEVYVDNVNAIRAYEKVGFKGNLLEMRIGVGK